MPPDTAHSVESNEGAALQSKDTSTRRRLGPTTAVWLTHREMLRFARQRGRWIGALGTPLVFWLLLGSGLDRVFVPPTAPEGPGAVTPSSGMSGYRAYFFPGMMGLVVLFTSIFSTISVIEDRRDGFLQAVLASPTPRWAIASAKILGGAILATVQGLLLLPLWWVLGGKISFVDALGVAGTLLLMGMAMTALGLCFAWRSDSTAGFHAVMNLLLMPMWMLSGALFPVATAPGPMRGVMLANPMTHGHTLLLDFLNANHGTATIQPAVALSVLIGATIALTIAATFIVATPRRDGT